MSSSYVDEDVQIGVNTKVWHFSHIQSGSVIGKKCSLSGKTSIFQIMLKLAICQNSK